MCVKCFITDAASAGDWDEVARLAREQKKTDKAEEKAQTDDAVDTDDAVKAEKPTSKAGAK
jgi:hypothetical protein